MKALLFLVIVLSANMALAGQSRSGIMVEVGAAKIRLMDLEKAMSQSLLSTHLAGQSRADVGALYAHWLRRLVAYQLLLQEAKSLKIQDKTDFKRLKDQQMLAILFGRYEHSLLAEIDVPEDVMQSIQARWLNPEAVDKAIVYYKYEHLNEKSLIRLYKLKQIFRLKFIDVSFNDLQMQSVLAEADGFSIQLADVLVSKDEIITEIELQRRLMDLARKRLVKMFFIQQGVSDVLAPSVLNDLLVGYLLNEKTILWAGDKALVKAFFDKTARLNRIPEARLIAQIVLATEKEADNLRKSILDGADFFDLASKYSLDPQGRRNKGIVGWFYQGQGFTALEKGIAKLENKQVSLVIKTTLGYHLVMILQRKQGEKRPFFQVSAVAKQQLLQYELRRYLSILAKKYPLKWRLFDVVE